ncbi:hypothetical protein BCR43DRAFT_491136 [Syncephalastrum racemosum]|uniref:Chromo domain-containing protein n=1 Tax=Syncephalastrum racemosum TaxID=13706 RepID=A0A1X2HBH6_SYNRA|nr:hypothetical protein BCR43DRAFT_491136 [Syncephalastrum racemosum]
MRSAPPKRIVLDDVDQSFYDFDIQEQPQLESIVGHRIQVGDGTRTLQYFVKWKELSDIWNTWETEDDIYSARDAIETYWQEHGGYEARQRAWSLVTEDDVLVQNTSDIPIRGGMLPATQFSDEEDVTLVLSPVPVEPMSHPVGRPAEGKQQQHEEQQFIAPPDYITISSSPSESSSGPYASQTEPTKRRRQSSDAQHTQQTSIQNVPFQRNMRVIFDLGYRTGIDWDWKKNIKSVEEVFNESGTLYGVVRWNDDRLAMYPTDLIRRRCPKELLRMYERHLKFEE